MSLPSPPHPPRARRGPTTVLTDFTHPTRTTLNQLALFTLGSTLLTFSTLLTHRRIRHHLLPSPRTTPFFTPSNAPISINSSALAFEALQLATLNVVCVGVVVAGGLGWGMDLRGWADLRGRVGKRRRRRGVGRVEEGDGDGDGGEEIEGLEELVRGREGRVERRWEMKVRERREGRENGDGKEEGREEEGIRKRPWFGWWPPT